jgi:uracil-DNA glycosylase family 4
MRPVKRVSAEPLVYKEPERTYFPEQHGAKCSSCPLRDQNNAIPCKPTTGAATLVILGEAPGPLEELQEEYFVGPSGNALKEAIASIGIPDAANATHLNNCLQCRPKKHLSVKDWRKATECCWPRLEKELCQSGAKMILGLGKWSQFVLRGKTDPIHDWCGSPYPVESPFCKHGEKTPSNTTESTSKTSKRPSGSKKKSPKRTKKKKEKASQIYSGQCITTYHPAFALRGKRVFLAVFEEHLERAWKLANGSLKPWKWPSIYAKDDAKAIAALKRLWKGIRTKKIIRIGVDIETNGSNPCLDSMTKVGLSSSTMAISLSWPLSSDAAPLVRKILAHPVAKAAHNGKVMR